MASTPPSTGSGCGLNLVMVNGNDGGQGQRSNSPVPPTQKFNSGSSKIVGGIEEVTGLQYPTISTVAKQYQQPLGQRVLIFVRANQQCCLEGGIETILKLQKSRSKSSSGGSSTSAGFDTTSTSGSSTLSDQYSYEDNDATSQKSSKGPNLGRFVKKLGNQASKVAKQTTATLERGMQELAIKADQGRSPDMLMCALYDNSTGILICTTDSVPMPPAEMISFGIPLVIPPHVSDTTSVSIKLFLESKTAMSKTKHYTLGTTQLHVGPIRQAVRQQPQQSSGPCPVFYALPITSTVLDAARQPQLLVCLTQDLKLPMIGQRGWSLSDPIWPQGYVANAYNTTLDQSYLLDESGGSGNNKWTVATERASESTVVIPIATACAKLYSQACQVSMQHAQSVATYLALKRSDLQAPGAPAGSSSATVTMSLSHMVMAPSMAPLPVHPQTGSTPPAMVLVSYQPPDSIFEAELPSSGSIMLPLTDSSNAGQQQQMNVSASQYSQVQLFPSLCTTNILPSILNAYGGRMPAPYLLGNVRVQIPMPQNTSNPPQFWEAIINLDQYHNYQAAQQQQKPQPPGGPVAFNLPVYSSNKKEIVGNLYLTLQIQLQQQQQASSSSTAPPPPPQHGLAHLVGLENLLEGVMPSLDLLESPTAATQDPQQRQRRQALLVTMGNFITHDFMVQHLDKQRKVDLQLYQERAHRYQEALDKSKTQQQYTNSWEDRTPRPFRPSSSRTTVLLSGIPFNTHNASFSLDVMTTNNTNPQQQQAPQQQGGALFHNVTCGAPADHANGFYDVFKDKSFVSSPIGAVAGGLRRLEEKRRDLARVVRSSQDQLMQEVMTFFQTTRQHNPHVTHIPTRGGFNNDTILRLRWKLCMAVQAYCHVTWICAVRRANAFSQALGIATTSYLASVSDAAKCQGGYWPDQWARHGYLVSFDGLLSAVGKELGMIEDASVAIAMLHMVRVVLVPDGGSSGTGPGKVDVSHSPLLRWLHVLPQWNNNNTGKTEILLQIGVHPQFFEQRIPPQIKNGARVQFFPLLFQVGVDIFQWGAHAKKNAGSNLANQFGLGDDDDDDDDEDGGEVPADDFLVSLNYEALRKMNVYAHSIIPQAGAPPQANPFAIFGELNESSSQQAVNEMVVHPALQMLHSHILSSAGKMNHSILDEAASVAQRLGGGGAVFCKSGKDRTAMHLTYKQSQFANQYQRQHSPQQDPYGGQDTTLEDARRIRVYGTRLPICEKNVGQALYAFNSLQSKFMPDALKPPQHTLAGFLKGGTVFDKLSGKGGIES